MGKKTSQRVWWSRRDLAGTMWVSLGSFCGALLSCSAGTQPQPQFSQSLSAGSAGRCSVAADANSPLVTEWPASEKAHLESLLARQLVAVEYSGCELRIVPGCHLAGSYTWNRTTLSTDSVDINSADELYAKLPVGALALEGQLERTGHLSVQTTVSGQMRATEPSPEVPDTAACASATHLIRALSVGAFKLYGGGTSKTRASANVPLAEVSNGMGQAESVLREAGIQENCELATEDAAEPQCASPLQLFLRPLRLAEQVKEDDRLMRTGAVEVSLPAPENDSERWTLRNDHGEILCTTPCSYWIPPSSQYYLQREPVNSHELVKLNMIDQFGQSPGSRVELTYQAERGSPFLSKLFFIGIGIPLSITGTAFTAAGIASFIGECGSECRGDRGLFLGTGIGHLATSAGLFYWYLWSHDTELEVTEQDSNGGVQLTVGPGMVRGTF